MFCTLRTRLVQEFPTIHSPVLPAELTEEPTRVRVRVRVSVSVSVSVSVIVKGFVSVSVSVKGFV